MKTRIFLATLIILSSIYVLDMIKSWVMYSGWNSELVLATLFISIMIIYALWILKGEIWTLAQH